MDDSLNPSTMLSLERQDVAVVVERRGAVLQHPGLARLAKDAVKHAAYATLGIFDRPPDRREARRGMIVNVTTLVDRITNQRGDRTQVADPPPQRLKRRSRSPYLVQPVPQCLRRLQRLGDTDQNVSLQGCGERGCSYVLSDVVDTPHRRQGMLLRHGRKLFDLIQPVPHRLRIGYRGKRECEPLSQLRAAIARQRFADRVELQLVNCRLVQGPRPKNTSRRRTQRWL